MATRKNWTTEDEIRFLQRLGKHTENKRTDPVKLLREYSKSIVSRKKWEDIDKDKVKVFVLEKLISSIPKR